MIDWALAGKTATVTIACLVIAAIIVKRTREWYAPKKTVEQEQHDSRLIVGTIPQHNPGVSVGEWTDDFDDPLWHVMNVVQQNRAASGL